MLGRIQFSPKRDNNTYTSIPSSSSGGSSSLQRRQRPLVRNSNDVRKRSYKNYGDDNTNASSGFTPIINNPTVEHGYRIHQAKDGSMITAVPIDKDQSLLGGTSSSSKYTPPQRGGRSSPQMFGKLRSSPINEESITGSTTWSTQGLLDARGKQRHKMKRMRPPINNTKRTSKEASFPHNVEDVVHTARDKLKQLIPRHDPSPHKKQQQQQEYRGKNNISVPKQSRSPKRSPRKPRVSWDLSPKRHNQQQQRQRQQQQQQQQQPQPQSLKVQKSNSVDDTNSFSSFPMLSPTHKFTDSFGEEERNNNINKTNMKGNNKNVANQNTTATQSYDTLLQQRMAEIQVKQKELAHNITKKDVIKGTLITAIDGNLERHRNEMQALDEELKEIQWHLKLDSEKKQQHEQYIKKNSKRRPINRVEEDITEIRLARSPSGAYDMESVEVDDPSITADTDSVADLYRNDKARRRGKMGIDPPARPSPPPPTIDEERQYRVREAKEPDAPRISAVLRGDQINIKPQDIIADLEGDDVKKSSQWPPLPYQETRQHQRNVLPQSQRGKFVHFNLPQHGTESDELKFASNSIDTPSTDFIGVSTNNIKDDISWKEEHFDVDAYDETTGSIISSEHHDLYQWTDTEQHVMVTEHYSREDHHRSHVHDDSEVGPSSPLNQQDTFNGNRGGVSSDSVTTDPDLAFINAVAAVVIQTAVRRFLAELVLEERRFAVNVIQSAICNWMARKQQNSYYYNTSNEMDYNEQRTNKMFHDEQYEYNREPITQRTQKRVMFEEDYQEFEDFAAGEIQRCWRGWWARDNIEINHFAATTIQRVFRGFWTREGLDVDRYCAIECQRIIRGYQARMACIYDLYCIIVAQSVARRYLAFYTSAVRLANILYIQAVYRGYRVRSELRRYVTAGQEVAATFIQSQWRSYDAQMNFINTLADILIVQSVARRWLTLRRMKRRKKKTPKFRAKLGNTECSSRPRKGAIPVKTATRNNDSHAVWQQHRLNMIKAKPSHPTSPLPPQHSLSEDSEQQEEWDDNKLFGNKAQTSDMLKSWKGRKSR